LALMLTARAYAVIAGRDYVVPEDVKAVAPSVLAHRVTVKPELWMSDVTGASVIRSVLNQVDTPGARESSPFTRPGDSPFARPGDA
jgi:MoxR-like ATPase